uniref:Uncharacterized protein n=1 Tax=Arundo donax TaxID=35708 RepID=A0A0A9B8K8_ARUDO
MLTYVASSHCSFNISLKHLRIITKDNCCFMVQGILIVWLRKKEIQAINNSVDVENRLPILTENVQTNISFQINIWMVHLGLAFDLWWLMRIRWGHLKRENESASHVISFIRSDDDLKIHQIILAIGKRN